MPKPTCASQDAANGGNQSSGNANGVPEGLARDLAVLGAQLASSASMR